MTIGTISIRLFRKRARRSIVRDVLVALLRHLSTQPACSIPARDRRTGPLRLGILPVTGLIAKYLPMHAAYRPFVQYIIACAGEVSDCPDFEREHADSSS